MKTKCYSGIKKWRRKGATKGGEEEEEQKEEKGKKKLSHQYHFFVSQIWSSDSLWLLQPMA